MVYGRKNVYYTCLEWGCSLCNQTTLITDWLVSGINGRGQSDIRSVRPFNISDRSNLISLCLIYAHIYLDQQIAANKKCLKRQLYCICTKFNLIIKVSQMSLSMIIWSVHKCISDCLCSLEGKSLS